MAKVKEKDEDVKRFLLSFGRALNVSGLEHEIGAGRRTVRDWIQGRRSINPRTLERLKEWAKKYGH